MYPLLVGLTHLLCLTQSHYLLPLVEVLHLELRPEFEDLFGFAFALRHFGDSGVEGFVELLEVALFFGFGHEEEGRQLGVVLLEGFSFLVGEHLDVIGHAELFALLLALQLILVLQLRCPFFRKLLFLLLFLLGLRLLLFPLAGEIRSIVGFIGLVEIENASCPQSIAVGF